MNPLSATKARWGPAPRTISVTPPEPPSWMDIDEPLGGIWKHHPDIVRDGRLVMAKMFMANNALFEDGDDDAPASVVYSFDTAFERHPEWLEPIGDRLYTLYDSTDSDEPVSKRPWSRQVQDDLFDGMKRVFHQRLPPELTGGPIAYHSTIMVFRHCLPARRIESMWLPLLVHSASGYALQVELL